MGLGCVVLFYSMAFLGMLGALLQGDWEAGKILLQCILIITATGWALHFCMTRLGK